MRQTQDHHPRFQKHKTSALREKSSNMVISLEQRQRMEENRQRAMTIRKDREEKQRQILIQQQACASSTVMAANSLGRKRPKPLQDRLACNPFTSGGFIDDSELVVASRLAASTDDCSQSKRPKRLTSSDRSCQLNATPQTKGEPSSQMGTRCEACGASIQQQVTAEADPLLDAFDVSVCVTCRREDPDYELLPKSAAQQRFLLPDASFKVLRYVEKKNPRHSSWQPMKLYLVKHVRARSYVRWGGEEGLGAELERRDAKHWDRTFKRTAELFANPEG